MSKRYQYIVGIDFGTFSTSFSFAHVDNQETITIQDWPQKKIKDFGGRISSSITYEQNIESLPVWGEIATKDQKYLFHAPHIKLYLTDFENQPKLPEGLKPVDLVSGYFKQLHRYGISKMKEHFNPPASTLSPPSSNDEESTSVMEDQIRYVVSFPDNKEDDYKKDMKEALIMAGIIKESDPDHKLLFITESEATAYYCLKQYVNSKKASLKPYLVCDIGGTVFGVSTIEARELFETGIVNSHIDKSAGHCGKIRLNKEMEEYIRSKISGPVDESQLKIIREKIYDFYIQNIKKSFNHNNEDTRCSLNDIEVPDAIAKLDCIKDNHFVFSQAELYNKIFGPVTNGILECIEKSMDKFSNAIGGVFLSGIIGEESYLQELVQEKFKSMNIKVDSIRRSTFAISEGLVYYGFRERDLTVPYLIEKKVSRKNTTADVKGGEADHSQSETENTIKKLNLKNLDYIIGLDFGTTYSGFAYAPVPKGDTKDKVDHNIIIKNIKTWPKQSHTNYPKAPSTLLYDSNMICQNKFGDDAKSVAARRNTNGVLLNHFKLLLCNSFELTADDKILANLDDFEVVEAVSDYFRNFTSEGKSRLAKAVTINDETRFGYVVSIPSAWSHEAKNTLMEAVKNAKLVPEENFQDSVMFITEAEAGAIYCERYFKEEFSMDRQQRFMICDAGGGTVDVATFEVGREDDLEGELSLIELTSSDQENCGSSYLDEKFRRFILRKFETHNIQYNDRGIENIVDQFRKDVKANFESSLVPDLEDDIKLQIPMSLGVSTDLSDIPGFIISNEISIKCADMDIEVFKPIMDRALQLIESQFKKLPESERQLDAILIVGGFGQSSYFHKAVVDMFENKAVGAKFIGRPPNGDLATSRGAVSFGLEPKTVSTNIVRYMYGLQVRDRFIEKTDNENRKVQGYKGELYCQNVFSSIVPRETKIDRGTVYIHTVYVLYPNDPIFAIYVTDGITIPRFTTNMSPVCKISVAMPNIPGIQEGSMIIFEVAVEISSTDIKVDIYHDGKLLKKENGVVKSKAVVKHCKPQRKGSIWTVPVFSPCKK